MLTAINFGHGLPRALAVPGVPVAAIADLSTYGLLTGIADVDQRSKALDLFSKMYAPTVGGSFVNDYLRSTGTDAMVGADIVKVAPERYSSNVEYPNSPIASHLRDIAQVYMADLGTKIFYTQHGSFDTHAGEAAAHPVLWKEVSEGISAFFQDMKEHNTGENIVMYLFSEFGRRVRDNGSGTDHGAAGVAFAIGDSVQGGFYGEYPSRKNEDLEQGDLVPNYDFRGAYSSIVEDWLGMDANPIVNGDLPQAGHHQEVNPSSRQTGWRRGLQRCVAAHPTHIKWRKNYASEYRSKRSGMAVREERRPPGAGGHGLQPACGRCYPRRRHDVRRQPRW